MEWRVILYLLFVVHCPVSVHAVNEKSIIQQKGENTDILLLFPVPKSIIMCLFLEMCPVNPPLLYRSR